MRRLTFLLLFALCCTVLPAQQLTHEMTKIAYDLLEAINKGKAGEQEADILADKYLALCTSDNYRYGLYYAEAKHVKARSAAKRGDYQMALSLMDEVIAARLDERSTAHNDDRLGLSYFERSKYHKNLQNIDQAITDIQAAAEAYKKAKKDANYATALCQMAQYYQDRGASGDAEHAEECYEKAFPVVEKGTPEFLSVAATLIPALNKQGKFSQAKKLAKQLQKNGKKVAEKDPIRYADFLLNASVAEASTGQYIQGLAYAEEAMGIYEKANRVTDHNYAVLMKNTADCHFHLQHNQQALELYERAKPLLLQTEGETGKVYEGCLQQLIATYIRIDPEKAQNLILMQQKQIYAGVSDTTTLNFANKLATQAHSEANVGNFKEAVSWGERALRRYEARGASLQQALMLYTLSTYYSHLGQQQRADSLSALSQEISHRRGFSQTEADALNQQGLSLYNKGQYEEADEVFQQAIDLLNMSGHSASTTYASILNNRALCQNALGKPQNAINLTHQALDLQTSILGPEHGDNVMPLYNLAMYHHNLKQMDSVAYYYHHAITMQTQQVRNNFSFQSTRQREQFWQGKSFLYQKAPLFATTPSEAPAELLADIYDAQLFTKGILLNSEIDFRRLLQRSADEKVLGQYDELQMLRANLQQCYEAKTGDGQEKIPELKFRIRQLENAVISQCKAYGDFTQNLTLTSDSVRRSLKADEAAVEFLEADITYAGKLDRLYLAIILRPEWKTPHACRLFFRSDIEKLGYPADKSVSELLSKAEWQNKIYNDDNLGCLVWKNLLEELDGATHVYFTPTGAFYQWGIEYMPIDANGTRIFDKLNVSRLSSTKLLAQRSNETSSAIGDGEVVIYGGMVYDIDTDEMISYHNQKKIDDDDDEDFFAMADAEQQTLDETPLLAMRERGASVDYLAYAKEEANDIETLLSNAGIKTERYDRDGTEESFKKLKGRNISLLHIATHGFSYSDKQDWLKSSTSSTDPLCLSGLLFSGCNNYMQHPNNFPSDIDDGILTAHEIADLNLQNLQLTVLSACQTGTGTLQEDGVFGVQRGFKKAGAHTLVMSLWSVNDAATKLMMTSFYEALLSGKSRHEAFLTAQKAVREAYPQPHYWAPFIMLDDI